jgi:hypothetical protein
MRLLASASSLARFPVFLVEQGVAAAAAAVRRVRPADRDPDASNFGPPDAGFVVPEREVVVAEREVVVTEPPEPVHVSEEPVLVAESAQTGAEDGAGAELRIEEPWEGYSSMTASEVRARLRDADAATAAAVKLYEAGHKGRSTVLQAASAPPSG